MTRTHGTARRPPRLSIAAALALVLLAALALSACGSGDSASKPTVPDVRSMTRSDAEATLKSVGLVGKQGKTTVDTDYPPDWVIEQDPAAGTTFKTGEVVTLVVANPSPEPGAPAPANAPSVKVPDVVGEPWTKADEALKKTGLKASYVYSNSSGQVPYGDIVSQKPKAGATAKKGSTVTLTVSLSDKPNPDIAPGLLPPSASD